MLTDNQLKLIRMQFNLLHDCIRSIVYFRYLKREAPKETAWIYITDVLSDHIVQSWCKVFGSYGENTHWKQIADAPEVAKLIKPFSRADLLTAVAKSESGADYHQQMLVARNEFFAHLDMGSMILEYPDLEPALQSALRFREWLSNLIDVAIRSGLQGVNKAVSSE